MGIRVSNQNEVRSTSSSPSTPPARFKLEGSSKVDVKEASDVAAIPGGGFIVVGDRSDSAEYITPEGDSVRFKLDGIKKRQSGLEAVAYDPIRKNLFVASEEKQELYRYQMKFDGKKPPEATLQATTSYELEGRENKGVEGLAYLPGDASPTGRPQLIMAKEGDPKMLLLLDDKGEGKPREIELDHTIKDACKDFSAVAVDPVSGHIFITSDASSLLAEVRLKRKGDAVVAELIQALPLRDSHKKPLERVEGATFDSKGNLYILQENNRKLLQLERK